MRIHRYAVLAAVGIALATSAALGQENPLDRALKRLFPSNPAPGGVQTGLSSGEIAAGLKDALRVGTARIVEMLAARDGFNADPEIHIPLPDSMRSVQKALGRVGWSGPVDDLELRLNRAAEAAAPRAKTIFWDAVAGLTFADVKAIYEGPDNAATEYFRSKTSVPLANSMRPVVEQSLAEVGAITAYESVMGQYRSMPFVPDVRADLTSHVLTRALDGLFLYLGREEAAIRRDPARRSTELLQRVFGKSP